VHQFKPLLAPLCAEVNSVYYVLRSSLFKVVHFFLSYYFSHR
jgi:hypothetical protein